MKATKFLIELNESTLLPSIEGLTVIELCNYQNWYNNDTVYEIYYGFVARDRIYKSVADAAKDYRIPSEYINYREFIPVGSIEFITYIKSILTKKPLKVINIPEELRKDSFLSREVFTLSKQEANELKRTKPKEYLESIIVKPGSIIKDFGADTLKGLDLNKITDDVIFASSKLDIITEWRVFIFNKKIIGIRRYLGDAAVPSLEFIDKCIYTYTKSPKAYTLDICRTEDGKFAVIEVHNFVACGHYGLEEPKLLNMYIAGWKYEIDEE